MIMIVISFALVKFYAFAILYVPIVMQIKLVVVVVVVLRLTLRRLENIDTKIESVADYEEKFLRVLAQRKELPRSLLLEER